MHKFLQLQKNTKQIKINTYPNMKNFIQTQTNKNKYISNWNRCNLQKQKKENFKNIQFNIQNYEFSTNLNLNFRKIQGPYNENNLKGFINYYRKNSHKFSNTDPLGIKNTETSLNFLPEFWGLSELEKIEDFPLDESSTYTNEIINELNTIKDLHEFLKRNYLSSTGVEFEHIENEEEKLWLYENYEKLCKENISNIELQNSFKILYPAVVSLYILFI
jgi:2-oxoglutarate dehydrogenase complex dehydrogenase (E1) component-like enzyme